jgi:hypothetical protein
MVTRHLSGRTAPRNPSTIEALVTAFVVVAALFVVSVVATLGGAP